MTTQWLSNMALSCKAAVAEATAPGRRLLFAVFNKALLALLTFALAFGGAFVGLVCGAIKGQTTETGFVRGAEIGAVAGAITALQLTELTVHGEPFSKGALLFSLMNGKVFNEWVSPAVLKAYQWQMSSVEAASSTANSSDIFEMNGSRGLSPDSIKKLSKHRFFCHPAHHITCIVCLEVLKNGEMTRALENCGHPFHVDCIDEWLRQHGSCPICRTDV
ncbi:NEP1-interacting protein-like 1 [Diospyros lotus]|uniref:NEP1-interacting protein-like 1 n=1 Tax=Diospyros lotus TaxID=55363 RepID=UPI002254EC63|nr:NEP1-interacting protein-like 1 [Diospyros lotus]